MRRRAHEDRRLGSELGVRRGVAEAPCRRATYPACPSHRRTAAPTTPSSRRCSPSRSPSCGAESAPQPPLSASARTRPRPHPCARHGPCHRHVRQRRGAARRIRSRSARCRCSTRIWRRLSDQTVRLLYSRAFCPKCESAVCASALLYAPARPSQGWAGWRGSRTHAIGRSCRMRRASASVCTASALPPLNGQLQTPRLTATMAATRHSWRHGVYAPRSMPKTRRRWRR